MADGGLTNPATGRSRSTPSATYCYTGVPAFDPAVNGLNMFAYDPATATVTLGNNCK